MVGTRILIYSSKNFAPIYIRRKKKEEKTTSGNKGLHFLLGSVVNFINIMTLSQENYQYLTLSEKREKDGSKEATKQHRSNFF